MTKMTAEQYREQALAALDRYLVLVQDFSDVMLNLNQHAIKSEIPASLILGVQDEVARKLNEVAVKHERQNDERVRLQ